MAEHTQGTSTSQSVEKGADGLPKKPSTSTRKGASKMSPLGLNLTNQESAASTPRFLVVKRKEGDFTNVSPFLIDKVLKNLVGEVSSVRKIRDGLLIETVCASQSNELLKVSKFHDFEVTVTPHNSLNLTKGVITCRDLLNCSLVEIIDNMADQGVIDAKRIVVRREGVLKETASLILTFNRNTLPKKVKAGIYALPVRLYIPAPMRCFRCHRFGHTSTRCNNPEICICGRELHSDTPCTDPIKCINCEGEHSARSRNCPIYKEEAAIQKIKTEERTSFAEARRRVKSSIVTPIPGVSYSHVLKTTNPPTDLDEMLKDTIAKLVPDIVKICLDTIKHNNVQTSNDGSQSSHEVATKEMAIEQMETNPITADKRKRGDNTPTDSEQVGWEELHDTDDAHSINSEPTTPPPAKNKPGGKRGRPRKHVKR